MKLTRLLIILSFLLAANAAWAADDDIYNDEPAEEAPAALESASPNGQEIISLIEELSVGSHKFNMESVEKIVAYGDEAVDYLAQAYWNSDGADGIRTYAMIALKRLGHKDAISTAARHKLSRGEATARVEEQVEEEDDLSELLMLNETLRRREDVAIEEGGGIFSPPAYEQSGRFSSVDDAMIEAEVQRRLESFREGFRQGYEEGADNSAATSQHYPYGGIGYPAPIISTPAHYYNDIYPIWYGGQLVSKDGGGKITVTRKNGNFLTNFDSYQGAPKQGKSAFWDSFKPMQDTMSEKKRKMEKEEEEKMEEELKAKGRR